MERKSCCSGMRCGSTPRVTTITPENKPMNVNIKKEEQNVKPQTLKKEATAAAAAATVKKEEQDVKPQTLKKEVVKGKEAATVKKEEPAKVNVGCGGGGCGGGGCSSFK